MTPGTSACTRCASPLEREDLRCPICNAAAPQTVAADLERTTVEVLRCEGCGAAVSYDVRARAPACAFCGSVMQVEVPEDPLEQAQHCLPFTVDRAHAEAAYRRWLGGLGWFRPSDLGSASRVESMTPLWWVGWVFDAEVAVTWAADSDAGARRADWAPHGGETGFAFENVVVSASRGLSASETGSLIPTYDLESATAVPDEQPPGTTFEQFDMPRSSARRRVAAVVDGLVKSRLERDAIPGSRFRNIHAALVLRRLVTRRFAFPSHVVAYRYRGSLHRVVISGQDATCLVGSAPYSTAKILTAVFGGLFAAAIVIALIAAL